MMRLFQQLNNETICRYVENAKYRVAYIGPALNQYLAARLARQHKLLGTGTVTVVVDYNEDIFRLGYGEHEAIEILQDAGITIRKETGLRISALLVDDQAWVLHQSPMAVENPKSATCNAIALLPPQIDQLVNAVGITSKQSKVKPTDDLFDKGSQTAEIGVETLADQDVKAVKKNLDNNPPQAFDLQRQVRVYSSYLQFVEIELSGGRVGQRTIKLPDKIRKSIFGNDEEIEKRLTASYRLLDGSQIEGLADINKQVDELREYTRQLNKRLGRVMLVSHKKTFTKKRDEILQNIEKWKKSAIKQLQSELDTSINALARAGAGNLLEKSPTEFVSGFTSKPTRDDAEKYLADQFKRTAPSAEKLLNSLTLQCTFKDVTYEMLKEDKEFLKCVHEAFPDLNKTLLQESDAAFVRSTGPTPDLFSH
ncbi:hypothetical protein [Venatoribacter cucullus]|uniref:hypothetical protein n=1 Tax=Venatoribacter cucullus TaxID=2661630 RepID=UPI00223FBFC7|nr:hypothetical protein [Venatoribacter cucullus]UZK04783.1 hypothetical protein GAY96_13115 [Venatoribacter cucullus]